MVEMEINSKECVTCSICGYEIATVKVTTEGIRALKVYDQIELTIIDKEKDIGIIKCPKCGAENQTNLLFWRQF
jgi:transcription elongation factor Elf1